MGYVAMSIAYSNGVAGALNVLSHFSHLDGGARVLLAFGHTFGMLLHMKTSDSRVRKVTISLPAHLFVQGEQERTEQQISRSEFVASLYQRHFDRVEKERRIAQYTAAYAADPVTPVEQALTEASMALLGAESDA